MTKSNKRLLAKAETRAKVLTAARALWAEPGTYEVITMRGLAAAAGMSTGAILNNWAGKEELWQEAMGFPAPRDCAEVRAALQTNPTNSIGTATENSKLVLDFIEWVEAFTGTLPERQSEAMFDLYDRARRIYRAVDPTGHDAHRTTAAPSRLAEAA